ncbi:MAG: hypothetical protein RLZZ528_2276 [Pseudomonadota bacterium]|jgi:GNAT superfamily N-acetyltransferase
MSVTIRPVTCEDEPVWRQLWSDYLAFYNTALPAAVYAQTFRRMVERDHPGPYGLLAERDGVVVGLVHYLFHRSGWKIEDVCYLQDLFVAPEARGTGAGRALIEAVYAEADRAGAPSVYWLTQEFNYAGRMLYDRVGVKSPFIRYGRPT